MLVGLNVEIHPTQEKDESTQLYYQEWSFPASSLGGTIACLGLSPLPWRVTFHSYRALWRLAKPSACALGKAKPLLQGAMGRQKI